MLAHRILAAKRREPTGPARHQVSNTTTPPHERTRSGPVAALILARISKRGDAETQCPCPCPCGLRRLRIEDNILVYSVHSTAYVWLFVALRSRAMQSRWFVVDGRVDVARTSSCQAAQHTVPVCQTYPDTTRCSLEETSGSSRRRLCG